MRHLFLLLQFGLVTHFGFSQNFITSKVLDSKSREPLVYCHIINIRTQFLYITNTEGAFRINDPNMNDSLRITYLGYKDKTISVSRILKNEIILLEPDGLLLNEVTIKVNDKTLLDLVFKAGQRLRKAEAFASKAYLELYSEDEGDHLELLQMYYNIKCKGAHISDFRLKAGKIALTNNMEKMFVNLGSTFALTLLNPAKENDFYPKTPFELSRNRLGKQFYLRAISGTNANNGIIHLEFEPMKMKDSLHLFSGEMWIRKADFQVMKLKIVSNRVESHPFYPIRITDSIEKVAVEMNYHFHDVQDRSRLTLLTFDYTFDYVSFNQESSANTLRKIQTDGLIHMYDDNELFILPYFEYDPLHNDYRKVSLLPYNNTFWMKNQALPSTELQKKRYKLFSENGITLNFDEINSLKTKNKHPMETLYDFNNIFWDKSAVVQPSYLLQTTRSSELFVQLYLDINKYNDTFHILSKTILDVFKSHYNLVDIIGDQFIYLNNYFDSSKNILDVFKSQYNIVNKIQNHFIYLNIYFDLAEIVRRKMHNELVNAKDLREVDEIYINSKVQLKKLLNDYTLDVESGKKFNNLKKWNDQVVKELQRDHIRNFKARLPIIN